MGLDLELADSFVAVVDEWSFGRASEALHVSRPALTKRIQRLERELGVRLLERGPEGLTGLTPAGMHFARHVRPLLAQARAVQRAAILAQTSQPAGVLRVGAPLGATSFLPFIDLDTVLANARADFPGLRLSLVEVPFALLDRCLPESYVDVLLTVAPVRHRAVRSTPLPLTANRIGVVSQRHALAGAGAIDVADFCDHRLLWNPSLPPEWMRPFWLGDLRTKTEAQLLAVPCFSNERVLREANRGAAAIVTLSPDRGRLLPGLQEVELVGVPPVRFYAAHREEDRRPTLQALVSHLDGRPPQHAG